MVIYAVNQQQLSSDATAAVLLCVALGAQFATTACRLIMAHMSKTSLRVVVVQQASNTTAAVVVEVGVPVAVGVGLLLMGGPHWAAATLLLWAGVVCV